MISIDILYDTSNESIWGNEDPAKSGINAWGSEESLVKLTEQAIRQAYPEAKVSFRAEERNGSRIYVESSIGSHEDEIMLDIMAIIERVYDLKEWIVQERG